METAVLRLGLAGFDAGRQAAIRKVAAAFRHVDWDLGGPDGADAWLVNGAGVAAVQEAHVRVMCTDASGRMMPIVIDTGSRPVAFGGPVTMPVPGGPHALFGLGEPGSLLKVLHRFDRELQPTKACFWTAAHIALHHATIGKAMFELRAGTDVLAVVDMKGHVAVSPAATETAFNQALWKHRARTAVTIPAGFRRIPLSQLMWLYATRTRRELLPPRYRDGAIFFRRPPRVDPQMIDDVHLVISRQLALGPSTFDELQTVLEMKEEALAKALAALYFVGSITSNPDRAWRGSVRGGLWSRSAPLESGAAPLAPGGTRRDVPHSTAPLL